jgi:hypothetical protein
VAPAFDPAVFAAGELVLTRSSSRAGILSISAGLLWTWLLSANVLPASPATTSVLRAPADVSRWTPCICPALLQPPARLPFRELRDPRPI